MYGKVSLIHVGEFHVDCIDSVQILVRHCSHRLVFPVPGLRIFTGIPLGLRDLAEDI